MSDGPIIGKISFINREKLFGFIKSIDNQLDSECYFFKSAIRSSCKFDQLQVGDSVEFIPQISDKPTPRARFIAKEMRLRQLKTISRIGAYSRKGRGHDLNEDELFASEVLDGERVVGAVADGLSNPQDTGWWSSSEVMTFFVTEYYKSNLFKDRTPLKINPKEREQQVRLLINEVQDKFRKRQKEMTDNRRQSKSTLTFFVSDSDYFVCGSAGDSYLLKADMAGTQKPSYQVGSKGERRSSIVQSAVGEKNPSWHPTVLSRALNGLEMLVLCTDGIIIDTLRRFITSTLSNQKIAESLVDYSIQESGRDDATCVLLSWSTRQGDKS